MYGKSNIEICTTMCRINGWGEFAVWLRKLKQALCQPGGVGWGGRWEMGSGERGIHVYLWLIHVEVWQKTTEFCKAIILQLKKKKNLPAVQETHVQSLGWEDSLEKGKYSVEVPVLCSRSLLIICPKYSSVYMSISNSQSIPRTLPPSNHKFIL